MIQAESTAMLLTLGNLVHLISSREGFRKKALRSCTIPAPPLEVTKSRFSPLKNGDNDTYLRSELGV